MKNLHKIHLPFEVKSFDKDGTFSGYASVFGNVDLGRDIVVKGAFAASLAEHATTGFKIKMLWQHSRFDPIGVLDAKEDDKGLFVEGKIAMGVQKGREAHELIEMGALGGMSIGYSVNDGGEKFDKATGIRSLTSLKLWEVSPVTFPMNVEAGFTGVKSVRDFEEFLTRDAGFTRSQAITIINHGYKALKDTRDAVDESDLVASLKNLNNILKTGAKP